MRSENEGSMASHGTGRNAREAHANGQRRSGRALLALALLGVTGASCVTGGHGSNEEAAAALAGLVTTAREPLPPAAWRGLPAGCEDTLETADAIVIAPVEGAPSLCAVIVDGEPRCVDAAGLVADLLRIDALEPGALAGGLDARVQPTTPTGATTFQRSSAAAGDPSPQPSAPPPSTVEPLATPPNGGDPSPQPSDRSGAAAGDPSPQPSQPVREPGTY